MKVHQLIQGSPEWLAYRTQHFNASDAPAMMGCSPYKTRTQLLHELHTGRAPEVDAATKRRFDDGHRFEELARSIAVEIIGEDLYPVVGSDGELSASFDGINMAESRTAEHKSLNDEIRAALPHQGRDSHLYNDATKLGKVYRVQMEQQLMVSKAEDNLFSATKWDGDNLVEERHAWYRSDPVLRAEILAGWKQFAIDLAAYVPAEVIMPAVAAPQFALPAVSIQVNGSIALVDNLDKFGAALAAYVERINKKPKTDQDFADLEATIKTLKAAEDALDSAENGALAQTASIDTMRRTVALYRDTARTNRLLVEKLVKVEKENRRTKIVGDAVAELVSHVKALNVRLGKLYMPTIAGDFQGVVKGLKSLDSMRDKVAGELARCKIEANEIADRIQANLATLCDLASEHAFLFADSAQIVLKANDDLTALVKSRIAEHQAVEAAKEAALVARIEAEAKEKAEKEAADRQAADNAAALGEIQGIQQQVYIATTGRAGVRKGGTIECIRATLAETEAWVIDDRFGALKGSAQVAKDNAVASIRALLEQAEAREAQAAAAPASAPTPATPITHSAVVDIMMPATVRQAMAPKPATPPTLALGAISERLGFNVTSAFLASLGFEATTVKAAKLFQESDFFPICMAIIDHIESVSELQAA